jgi:phosphoenolpyruvate synthase/pyruvate phosphate dikinase
MNESERIKSEVPKCEIHFPCADKTNELVLLLSNPKSENLLSSGGKGSSLASLKILSKQIDKSKEFEVPDGIIVTGNAYELMVNNNKQIADSIKKLKTFVRYYNSHTL